MFNIKNLLIDFDAQNRILVNRLLGYFLANLFHNLFIFITGFIIKPVMEIRDWFGVKLFLQTPVPLIL